MRFIKDKIGTLLLKFCLLLVRLVCRVRVVGEDNIERGKGGLIVCNHVSLIDSLLLLAGLKRDMRFLVDRYYYDKKILNPICRLFKAIPIDDKGSKESVLESILQARETIEQGKLVCVFAEGAITRNGMLLSFRSGYKRVVSGMDCKVYPAYIGGAWDTIFSYRHGRPFSTFPKKIPCCIEIHIGSGEDADINAFDLRQRVLELGSDYFERLKSSRKPISWEFVKVAKRKWLKKAVSDSTGKVLSYGKLLIASLILAGKLRHITEKQARVGVLLPSSVAGVITNISLTLLGKVVVNLNYTASKQARDVAVEECELKTIVTSKLFLKKLESMGVEKSAQMLFLEDIMKNIVWQDRVKASLKAIFLPANKVCHSRGFNGDDLAAIMYSSGSSGRPKGVMLSHHNIFSNIESSRMVFRFTSNDDICGVLPLFHCFGYTCTMWLPLLSGISASYVTSPLDCEGVGKTIKDNRSTILIATPTFVSNYTRRIPADCFDSVRLTVVGAEKLKKNIADAFYKKFNKCIVEGYGATELSPVAILNTEDIQTHKGVQVCSKPGTIGQPIPGVAVRILDIETGKQLRQGKQGLLMVRGPIVMLGYLNLPEETSHVLHDGWYSTGDVAKSDEDGFITLCDRLTRFSKIGGEMVPHLAIEDVYLESCDMDHQVIAVTSVPDDRKGEELVVLYLPEMKDKLDMLHEVISKSDIPNIWKPRRSNYFEIPELPFLGSGKIDILALRKLAIEAKLKEQ